MAARAVILGCSGPTIGPEERRFFTSADPWGFILFRRNIESPEQVARLTADLRAAVGRRVPGHRQELPALALQLELVTLVVRRCH